MKWKKETKQTKAQAEEQNKDKEDSLNKNLKNHEEEKKPRANGGEQNRRKEEEKHWRHSHTKTNFKSKKLDQLKLCLP